MLLRQAAKQSSTGTPSTLDLNDTRSEAAWLVKPEVPLRNRLKVPPKMAAQGKLGGAQLPSMIADKFNPCAIRGLGMFDVKGSPMGLAALCCSVCCLFPRYDGWQEAHHHIRSGGYLGFSTLALLFNIYAYREFGCFQDPSMMGILEVVDYAAW